MEIIVSDKLNFNVYLYPMAQLKRNRLLSERTKSTEKGSKIPKVLNWVSL